MTETEQKTQINILSLLLSFKKKEESYDLFRNFNHEWMSECPS
jgi:hypothetical protein